MEIERKWLIDKNSIPYNLKDYDFWDVEQAYISFSPTIRIRRISNKNNCYLTIKSASIDNGLSRQEYELEISNEQYNNLLNKKEGLVLSKTRYRVPQGNLIMEIDFFHLDYEGFAYMEVEFESVEQANKYIAPDFVIKEITSDSRYSNASLAKRINLELFKNNF